MVAPPIGKRSHWYLAFWLHLLLVAGVVAAAKVVVVNTDKPRTIPLVASFVGLTVFIWIAENIATFLGAWAYPDQLEG